MADRHSLPAAADAAAIDRFIADIEAAQTHRMISLGSRSAGMISLGLWHPDPGTRIIRGRFPHFALLYTLRGKAVFYDRNEAHQLKPGSLVYRTPGTHKFTYDDADHWREFFIQLPPDLYDAAPNICPTSRINNVPVTIDILEVLKRAILEYDTSLPHTVLLSKVYAVLGMFDVRIRNVPSSSDAAIHSSAHELGENIADEIDLPAIASRHAMTYDLFRKEFKRLLGLSPLQYRLRKRIEHAQMLLASGTVSASEVAVRVGYNDIFTFFKQFKRITGITPKAYRRSLGRG